MKKTLLSILIMGVASMGANAQMYSPSASALTGGTINTAYAGQAISFTVSSSATVSGSVAEDAIIDAYPAAAAVVGFLGLSSQTFDFTVTSTTLDVSGLPAGITMDCGTSPCTFAAGASGTLTLAGTPTVAGNFTVDITTLTAGEVDLSAFAGQLSQFGVPSSLAVPQPVPGALDEDGYTMAVADPNGIAENNEVFSLGLYPNPNDGLATLNINSTVADLATVEVYSITGAMVQTSTNSIRVGANRLNLDLETVPAGIYMVKTNINGSEALVRMQVK